MNVNGIFLKRNNNIKREKFRLSVYFRNFIQTHVYFRKAKSWKINTAMDVIKYGRPYFECLCSNMVRLHVFWKKSTSSNVCKIYLLHWMFCGQLVHYIECL